MLTSEPVRAAADLFGYLARAAPSAPARGDGHVVVLFPGLGTNGLSLKPLRRHLSSLGYRAMDWGQGFNTGPAGDVEPWLSALRDRLIDRVDRSKPSGGAMSLVGWSLGGLYAREIAKLMPQRIRRVITIGTPFNGTQEQTHVAWLFKLLSGRAREESPQFLARLASPPPVPTTAIYSRRDGIVAWQACRHGDRQQAGTRDIEVTASHLGMGWNRQVLAAVASELARPKDGGAAWQHSTAS